MITSESSESRWFVIGASGAMLCGFLAALLMLTPAPFTFAQSLIGRLSASASAAQHRLGHVAPRHVSTLTPGIVPGPLNGEPTPRANAMRRPIAVMIDNYYPDARPQSGVTDASVVFETLVEGGYTRLMAVYLEHDPSTVGPVRSTRIYYDDWAAAYHAILVHVGGNDDADAQLWQMRQVYNLDQGTDAFLLGYMNPYFWRTTDRSMPDNMFADIGKLRTYAAKRGQNWRYENASLPHKALDPVGRRGKSGSVTISFVDPLYPGVPANPDYQVQYRFNAASDSYDRIVGGKAQVDAGTHRPIRARNVVVMYTGPGTADTAAGTTVDAVSIPVVGSGSATFYYDGRVERGTWRQKDAFAPLQFLNSQGKSVRFNPGQTWVEAVPVYSSATWTSR